jgi:hypothetical protein
MRMTALQHPGSGDGLTGASLRQRIAAAAQREYEDSITTEGRVADAEYLGARTAVAVLVLFEENAAGTRDKTANGENR